MSSQGSRQQIHGHSGWLIPMGFGIAILLLCGAFLGWYLRPGMRGAAPTDQSSIVHVWIMGRGFAIPANYIEDPVARAGGDLAQVTLAARFPSWQGYSDTDARLFSGNAPDSPLVHVTLRGDTGRLPPAARLERIYKPYVVNAMGVTAPFGLTQYSFRDTSGYENSDLFVGNKSGLVLLLCERIAPGLTSPNCLVADQPLGNGLSVSYRFKRAWLARWPEIASGATRLARQFAVQ